MSKKYVVETMEHKTILFWVRWSTTKKKKELNIWKGVESWFSSSCIKYIQALNIANVRCSIHEINTQQVKFTSKHKQYFLFLWLMLTVHISLTKWCNEKFMDFHLQDCPGIYPISNHCLLKCFLEAINNMIYINGSQTFLLHGSVTLWGRMLITR